MMIEEYTENLKSCCEEIQSALSNNPYYSMAETTVVANHICDKWGVEYNKADYVQKYAKGVGEDRKQRIIKDYEESLK